MHYFPVLFDKILYVFWTKLAPNYIYIHQNKLQKLIMPENNKNHLSLPVPS